MKQTPDPLALDDPLTRLHRLAQELNGAWQPEQRAELNAIVQSLREREHVQTAGLAAVDRFQEQARISMAGYAELFEFAADASLVTDVAGNIQQANRAASVLLHTPREFLVRKPLPFYVAPQDRTLFYTRLIALGRGQETATRWPVRLQPTRGGEVSAELTVTPTLGEGGRLTGLRWQLRDITARARAEDALRAEKEFAEGLIEAAQVIVLIVDDAARLVRANFYLEALSGYRPEELGGHLWHARLLPAEDWARLRQEFERVLREGWTVRGTTRMQTKAGPTRVVQWSARPLRLVDGKPAVLAVGHDITELQEAQRQALHMERLAAIGQMATGLAHESRNAVQRCQACLERLRWMLEDNPQALDLVARAKKAQEDLLRHYEDVREYATPIKLERTTCDVAGLWRGVWDELLALTPQRDARLEEQVTTEPSCPVDRYRMGQVFRNIFENALAACPDPVRVRVVCREADVGDGDWLCVGIRDNGPGLTDEQRRRMFEPFYTTKTKGTGLGMAIAKRIVEGHGGRMGVGDAPPPGAEFVIHLPRTSS